MSGSEVLFVVFAVLILGSVVVENRVWRAYVRLCRGAPVRKHEPRAHTRDSITRR